MRLGKNVSIFEPIVVLRPEMVSIGDESRVDSFVKIEGGCGVYIGKNCHIASFCHINVGGGKVFIEDGATMSSGAKLIGGSNDVDSVSCSVTHPQGNRITRKQTVLGKNACLFTGAIVLPGLEIGEGARIGAGSVVTRNVPAFEIWAGNPAQKIGWVKQ